MTQASSSQNLLVFLLDGQRFALPLPAVDRVVEMVIFAGLPGAPENIEGVIDVAGRLRPVANLRSRFGLAPRRARADDHLVLARTRRREIALVVDRVEGVVARAPEEITAADAILAGLRQVVGVTRCEDGLIVIHHLDELLWPEEEQALDDALGALAASNAVP